MLHHAFFLPFLIFHLVVVALLFVIAALFFRPLAMAARYRCASNQNRTDEPRSSDNSAFEDYRQATLRRLEQEADEFRKYLDGLRRAADASAFDAFLKARRAGGQSAS